MIQGLWSFTHLGFSHGEKEHGEAQREHQERGQHANYVIDVRSAWTTRGVELRGDAMRAWRGAWVVR